MKFIWREGFRKSDLKSKVAFQVYQEGLSLVSLTGSAN